MNKRAIITSALPYANGEIHLGHVASTYLPADVTTRFLKQNGVEAYYVCASDDFGTPILIQSEKQGKTPADYVAHWNKRDYDDFTAFGINFDSAQVYAPIFGRMIYLGFRFTLKD